MENRDAMQDMLHDYVQSALAMEESSGRMQEQFARTTREALAAPGVEEAGGEELARLFDEHGEETRKQEQRLRERAEELGVARSPLKEVTAAVAARGKGFSDFVKPDKPGQNARDAYAAEHLEVASYAMLAQLARRFGDDRTADIADESMREEQGMADRIAERWQDFMDLMLVAESVTDEPLRH